MVRIYRKKRNYYRKGKTLSKRNIYRKKSAYSQAKQIAALTRKINKVSQINRPEITTSLTFARKTFTNMNLTDPPAVADTYLGFQLLPNAATFFNYASGGGGNFPAINGVYQQIWNGSLKLNVQYQSGSNSFGQSGHVRVIMLQCKGSGGAAPSSLTPNNIVSNYSTSTLLSYDMLHMRPLRDGITAEFRVLYDRTYNINSQSIPERTIKVRIPRVRYEKPALQNNTKGLIFGFIIFNGLEIGSTIIDSITLDAQLKVGVSDNQ